VDLSRYLGAIWKWWWLIAAATVLAATLGYLVVRTMPTTSLASTTLLVGDPVRRLRPGQPDFGTAASLAETYAQLARGQLVLEATVEALGLRMSWEELRRSVLVVYRPGQLSFEIRATATDPQVARKVVEGIATQLIEFSPTAANQRDQSARQQFVREELNALQLKIDETKAELENKRAALAKETSARGVLDRQDEIQALELGLSTLRSTYGSLITADQGTSANLVTVVEPAAIAQQSEGLAKWWIVAIAMLAAFLLTSGGVLLIERLDDSVKTKAELESVLELPTLGLMAHLRSLRGGPGWPLVVREPTSPAAESYRLSAVSLAFACQEKGIKVLLVTSANSEEGRSTTAANLAAALAESGRSVLLVDLDLANPTLHAFFDNSNTGGVTTLLGESSLEPARYVAVTCVERLGLLPAGGIPRHSTALLSRFGEPLLQGLRGVADLVIIDGPPLLAGADALALAGQVDGVLLVVQAGRTRRRTLRAAQEALARTGVRVVGTFLNGLPTGQVELFVGRRRANRARAHDTSFVSRSRAVSVEPSVSSSERSW
jgi:non-specific protein-tyrosine kinase